MSEQPTEGQVMSELETACKYTREFADAWAVPSKGWDGPPNLPLYVTAIPVDTVEQLIATIRTLQARLKAVEFRLRALAEIDTQGQDAMMTIPTWVNVYDILEARRLLKAKSSPPSTAGVA